MASRKAHRAKLKAAIFEKYGNKCANCEISDFYVLQVDHVKGNGRIERRLYSNDSTPAYLRRILQDQTGAYQLLCANCNLIKYHKVDKLQHT